MIALSLGVISTRGQDWLNYVGLVLIAAGPLFAVWAVIASRSPRIVVAALLASIPLALAMWLVARIAPGMA